MRSGYTLVELALVLTVTALLLGIALPSFTAAKQEVAVEGAAQAIASAHRRARSLAITRGRRAALSVTEGSLRITLEGSTVPHWTTPGPLESGITLAGAPRD